MINQLFKSYVTDTDTGIWGVLKSLGSKDPRDWKVMENDVFLECTRDLGQLLFRCLPWKVPFSLSGRGCHHHFLMDLWMTLMSKWWRMTFFWSVQVIWDNFCLDASLEKFHSPSQEGGCHHHFLMDLWMTLVRKWWRMTFFWSVQVIWDNFCLDASLEKFDSPSQEGGVIITSWWICGWHWWENGGEWGFCGMYKSFEKIFGCHLSTKNLMFPL